MSDIDVPVADGRYNVYRIDFAEGFTKAYAARNITMALQIALLDKPDSIVVQVSRVRKHIEVDGDPGPEPVPPLELLAELDEDAWFGPIETD